MPQSHFSQNTAHMYTYCRENKTNAPISTMARKKCDKIAPCTL
uniref:Uncharacterized protein n=1 Tax=Anguilla anguilla TaxID=7936 RepID=A0A0E9TGD1_ANGAN